MILDVPRSMVYNASRAVDTGREPNHIRKMVCEMKKFATKACPIQQEILSRIRPRQMPWMKKSLNKGECHE
jgi:hypothetical protein